MSDRPAGWRHRIGEAMDVAKVMKAEAATPGEIGDRLGQFFAQAGFCKHDAVLVGACIFHAYLKDG